MATKTKTGANGTTEALETFMAKGTDSMKQSFERMMGSYDKLASFSKENVDAFVQATTAATKGLEAINSEILSFSKQSVEDSMSAAKAAMKARSVQEFVELNSDFSKTAFDHYVGQVTKLGDMIATTARESVEPISGRLTAAANMVKAGQLAS
ncbi:MAG: phasin family protein [Alphaproteobacteria bacterium]|nr:phasin family protein [Alphaproteobacteria bacterium]